MLKKKKSKQQEEQVVEQLEGQELEEKKIEEKPEAKEQNQEKPRKSKKKIFIICIILVIILIGTILVFCTGKKKSSSIFNHDVELPFFYVVDGELKFIDSKKKEPVVVGNVDSEKMGATVLSSDGKYFLYEENNNLYLVDVKKESEKEKIVAEVEYFNFNEKGNYIIYTNEDGMLYSYNFKEKEKLDSDVEGIITITNDFLLYRKDSNIYMRSLDASKNDKKRIATDCNDVRLNGNKTKILYKTAIDEEKELYDYYVYTIKTEEKTKVLHNVSYVYDYSEEFDEFIYTVREDSNRKTYDLSLVLDDDMKVHDQNFKEYDYDDYWYDRIDYDTYYKNRQEAYKVRDRNDIRERLSLDVYKKYEVPVNNSYTAYYMKNDEKTKIASNVYYPSYADIETKSIIYVEATYNTSNKIKISDIDSLYISRALETLSDSLTSSLQYIVKFKAVDGDTAEITTTLNDYISTRKIENDLYCVVGGELFHAIINNNTLENITSIDKNAYIIDSQGEYKDSLLYVANINDSALGDLKMINGDKTTDIATDIYAYGITNLDNKKIAYYENYKDTNGNYHIYDGKDKTLLEDVYYVYYIRDDYFYVLKDYSSKSSTADLYRYNGNKLEKIDYGIESIY